MTFSELCGRSGANGSLFVFPTGSGVGICPEKQGDREEGADELNIPGFEACQVLLPQESFNVLKPQFPLYKIEIRHFLFQL
jgi:hypothetical protein